MVFFNIVGTSSFYYFVVSSDLLSNKVSNNPYSFFTGTIFSIYVKLS